MSSFVTKPPYVRCADTGHAVVVLNLANGKVETLVGAGRRLWLDLAATGEVATGAGTAPDQVRDLFARLIDHGTLRASPRPGPWPVPAVPETTPSWGTKEVPSALSTRTSPAVRHRALAWLALSIVILASRCGRRQLAFARTVGLIARATRPGHRRATATQAERALESVRHVAGLWPFRVACLEETAAAVLLLAATRRQVSWCHGVTTDPIRLHAWLEVDHTPIAEPASTRRYAKLLRIPLNPDPDTAPSGVVMNRDAEMKETP